MASRSLESLHPIVRAKVVALLERAQVKGVRLLVTAAYRSIEEQDELYAQGRTKPGHIVTDARGGSSAHNFAMAVDVVPLDANGQPIWKAPAQTWKQVWKLAEEVGLDALGDPWGEFVSWDLGHVQEPGWKVLKDVALEWLKTQTERG